MGYVFSEGSGICGVDIDTCRNPETGELSPEAREIVELLDSYTEVSPSGYGVHIYVEVAEGFSLDGFKKNGVRLPPNGIERYVMKDGKRVKKEPEIETVQVDLNKIKEEKTPEEFKQEYLAEPEPIKKKDYVKPEVISMEIKKDEQALTEKEKARRRIQYL